MISFIYRIIILTLFACVCFGALADDHSESKAIINRFFVYLKADNIDELRTILSPGRYENYSKQGVWETWINTWKRCTPIELGAVTEQKSYLRKDRDKTVNVKVTYDCGGQKLVGSINISLINGKWLWDEN